MKTELHIVGAGGHAKVVIDLAHSLGIKVRDIYDDAAIPGTKIAGYPVTKGINTMPDHADTYAVIAIGNNGIRSRLAQTFKEITWATLVHPSAWVSPSAILQAGTVVMAGAIVQADARLGKHVIVNSSASVDHDCIVEDYVHIAPGTCLAGNVRLDTGVFAGVSSSFIPGVSVGRWSVIGAGAVVTRSLPANVTAVGAPAKPIKEREPGWQDLP